MQVGCGGWALGSQYSKEHGSPQVQGLVAGYGGGKHKFVTLSLHLVLKQYGVGAGVGLVEIGAGVDLKMTCFLFFLV